MSWNTDRSSSAFALVAVVALCSVVTGTAAAGTVTVEDGATSAEASETAVLSAPNGTVTPTGTDGGTNRTATPAPTPSPTPGGGVNLTTATPTPAPSTLTPAAADDTLVVAGIETPADLRVGDRLRVNATVRNPASGNATGTVRYTFDGTTVAARTVTLGPGASATVEFDLAPADLVADGPVEPGTYVHGVRNASGEGSARWLRVTPDVDLTVEGFDAPVEVAHGEPYVVLATVSNPGDTTVTRQVAYEFAGRTVATRAVTVAGGDDRKVAFEVGLADVEAVVGPVEAETTRDHGVVTGDDRDGGAVRVVRGSSANASALAVEAFEATDDVRSGGTYLVNLTVRNVDIAGFEGQLSYRVDGAVVATAWTRVPIGERRTVRFRVGYDDVVDATYPLSARQTDQGVSVGGETLVTRPVSVHAPVGTATPRPTPTFASTPAPGPAPTSEGAATPAPDGAGCERGFLTACGGTAMDETSLTLFGVFLSAFGIVYEMARGRR